MYRCEAKKNREGRELSDDSGMHYVKKPAWKSDGTMQGCEMQREGWEGNMKTSQTLGHQSQ
jgi:hypothetical protein